MSRCGLCGAVQNALEALLGVDILSFVLAFDELILLEDEHGSMSRFAQQLGLSNRAFCREELAVGLFDVEKPWHLFRYVYTRFECLVCECAIDEYVEDLCVQVEVRLVVFDHSFCVFMTPDFHFYFSQNLLLYQTINDLKMRHKK